MFYHFFIGKKNEEMKKIQHQMHSNKTQQFFCDTIQYIHKHQLQNNQEVMSYLYGYICHYYLDVYTHPFVYYKTGCFLRNDKTTYRYNGKHQRMEYLIDCYLIDKREKKSHKKFKTYQHIFKVTSFSKDLQDIIKSTIGNGYNVKKADDIYLKCTKYMKAFFYIANYDPAGIKLKLYQLIDKITPEWVTKLNELSYYLDYEPEMKYLNLEHKAWCYPWDKEKIFYTSFLDLYDLAKEKAVQSIIEVTDLLEKEKLERQKLKVIFPDLSYITGKACHEKLEFRYFDF